MTETVRLEALVRELTKLPNETEWVEFKNANFDADTIGKDISALANAAVLCDKSEAYMVWGINDRSHEITGTVHNRYSQLIGNQEIESWLRALLSDNADYRFDDIVIDSKSVVVLTIKAANTRPVLFKKVAYIRVGSYTKKLTEIPMIESNLWNQLTKTPFESQVAMAGLSENDVAKYLDWSSYLRLLGIGATGIKEAIHYLIRDRILRREDSGTYSILNLGAILLALDLGDFERLVRKSLRVVQYQGGNRMALANEWEFQKGYALCFEEALRTIESLSPVTENIEGAYRVKRTAFPPIAVRELLVNALIHQNFSVTGAGPLVEVFSDRIEVTNPGSFLVDVRRVIDDPPRSRNEALAALMRRMKICEELGSGWDKSVMACEAAGVLAPRIDARENAVRVVLHCGQAFKKTSAEDRIWTVYMHACIYWINGEQMTNTTVKRRFSLPDASSATVSRLLKDCTEKGLIRVANPEAGLRIRNYVPFWA